MYPSLIADFHYRGYYPNYHTLRHFLSKDRGHQLSEKHSGFMPSEVEYRLEGSKETVTFEPHFQDVPLLSQPDKRASMEYLQPIIRGNAGDKTAVAETEKIKEDFRRKAEAVYRPASFTEDEFVIPSVS
ncbi:MAG TPA: hypothetical protein VMC08_05425, partial [Bacteroidales bacterium]|nr:hypothetical protein [Bacteroidales bacterium]